MLVQVVFMSVTSVLVCRISYCRAFVLKSSSLSVSLFLEQHDTLSDGKHNNNNKLSFLPQPQIFVCEA